MSAKTAKPAATPPARGGTLVDVTPQEVAGARDAIRARLRQAVINFKHSGEIGRISGLMSDLRALDFIDPAKGELPQEDQTPVDAKTAELHKAASDDAAMQELNRKVVKRERLETLKEEGIKE